MCVWAKKAEIIRRVSPGKCVDVHKPERSSVHDGLLTAAELGVVLSLG